MEDLKQALRDFVATSNSGKYTSEEELLSKFPELQGYDINVLRDFVATSNSGRYSNEEELFSKFPEFGQPVKKKEESSVPLWLQKQEQPKQEQPKQEQTLPFLESKPSGISLGSQRVPETEPIFGVAPPELKQPDVLDKNLLRLQTSLVDMDEEQAVEKLKYLYGDLGFTFDEAGFGYDAIKVTSPSGKELDLSWDNFSPRQDEYVLNQLTDFISKEGKAPTNKFNLENFYSEENKKFVDQVEINESIASVSKQADDINKFIKRYTVEKSALDKALGSAQSPDEYNKVNAQLLALESEKESMALTNQDFEKNQTNINKAIGKYIESEEKQGWFGGAGANAYLKGQGRAVSGAVGLMMDLFMAGMPISNMPDYKERFVAAANKVGYAGNDYNKIKSSLDEDQIKEIDNKISDELNKQLKYGLGTIEMARNSGVDVYGSDQTSEAYSEKVKQGFFGGALLGLAESIPSMLGPAPARVVRMFNSTTDHVAEEMQKDPDLKDISEFDKFLVSAPIGIVSSVLEEVGLRNLVANKGLLNSLTMRMLGKTSSNVTAKSFAEFVKNDVESMMARGLLTVAGASLAEFETGAMQEASEQGIKNIYNKVKGEEGFKKLAKTVPDFLGAMAYAGAQEAVGGFVLGTMPGVAAAYKKQGFEGMSDIDFEVFESIANDDKMESAFVASLKNKINSGELSVAEAKETLNDYRKSRGLYSQLPETLDTKSKKKAMNLLREKQGIEQSIKGKDEALVKRQKNRLEEINTQLEDLSKPKEDAVQEPIAEESVLRAEESQVGLQEMGEGNAKEQAPTQEVVKEEVVTPEEDLQAVLDRIEIPEDTEALPGIDDELKTINESIGRVKEPVSREKDDQVLQDLDDKIAKAKRRIATADDADVAIEEFKQAQKEKADFEETINKKKNFSQVDGLISDEIYFRDRDKGQYEYQELFDQDPRLAALQSAKDMVEFARKNPDENINIENRERDIKILEEDIAKFPVKQAVSPATPVVEAAPKVSSKTQKAKAAPKAKSVPIPVAIPKPAPTPAPKPVAVEQLTVKEPISIYASDGSLFQAYMKDEISKAFTNLGFKKFANLFRKHVDPSFSRANNTKSVGGQVDKDFTFEELAGYIIGDGTYTITEDQYRAFAKEAGIDIPKPAPKPAPKPVAVVSEPTTKAVGPESLQEEYKIKILEVRLNKDKSRTPRQIDERVKELQAEYQKLKAEMTAPRPKAEPEAKAAPKIEAKPAPKKAAPAPKAEPVVSKKDQAEIKRLEDEIEYQERQIEEATEELGNTNYNYEEVEAEVEKEREKLEGKKMSKQEREDAEDELDAKLDEAESERDSYLEQYNDQLREAKKEKKKAEKKLAKLQAKQVETKAEPTSVLEEDEPSYDDIKDLDVSDPTLLERVEDFLDDIDDGLADFGRGNLSSGMAIPLARAIIKSLKALVRAGITVQEAIKQYSAANNMKEEEIVELVREVYESQSAMTKLKNEIKAEVRSAAEANKTINQKRKDLSNAIKAMEATGKISIAKAKSILNKIGSLNLNNPVAVDNFLNDVENIFKDAAYEVAVAGMNAKAARAKRNVNKKIGTGKGLATPLRRLLAIKPSMIPKQFLDAYKDIVEMFGANDAVLKLDKINSVIAKVKAILEGIDNILDTIPDVTEILFAYENPVLNKDGSMDYAATIKKMKSDGTIDENQYETMRKYKTSILPKVAKVPQTEAEVAAEKEILIEAVRQNEFNESALSSKDEKIMAARLFKLSKTDAVNFLTNRQLLNLLKTFDNINNGYFSNYANTLYVELEAASKVPYLKKATLKAEVPTVANIQAKWGLTGTLREAIFERIKNIMLFNIGEVFGDFKTKDMFEAVLDMLASRQQAYKLQIEKINQKIDDMQNQLAASYGRKHNSLVKAKMKLAIYRIQREFKSNPGDKRVNPALAYMNATIKRIKEGNTMYSDRDAKLLQLLAKEYTIGTGEDARIDHEKLLKSFTPLEIKIIDELDKINKSIEHMAVFTGDVIRGDRVDLLIDYNHINVLPSAQEDPTAMLGIADKFKGGMVSTKAGSLIERSEGVKAINFDIFTTMQRGANQVAMDYYLTNPVRIARKTISLTEKSMEDDGTATDDTRAILGAIGDALNEAMNAMLDQSSVKSQWYDNVVTELAKSGVRMMLAGVPRATVELTSNMAYVTFVAPTEFTKGVALMNKISKLDIPEIMSVVGSNAITRTWGSNMSSGRMIDSNTLDKRTGGTQSTVMSPLKDLVATLHNKSTKRLKNAIDLQADTLISTPDKVATRPLWLGSFHIAFKSITGKNLTVEEYQKIKDSDVDFMLKYGDSLESARRVADEQVAMAGNVDNPFMNSLRSFVPADAKFTTKAFKTFNNFMNKFQIGEYLVARKGIHAAVGDGSMSKLKGVRLMAGVISRMTTYAVLNDLVTDFMYNLFLDDDEEDKQKDLDKRLRQGLLSTATSLLLGRTYGNLARTAINIGVEQANKEYGGALRNGEEYDPYEDALQYTFVAPEKTGKEMNAYDLLTGVAGPYSPFMKTAALGLRVMTQEDKKEGSAIERADDEKYLRLPFEILGHMGYAPFYKDIRAMVNRSIYAQLDRELSNKGQGGEEYKPMGMDKTDLKRYYPDIYEQYYGEGSAAEAKRKLEYEKNLLEQKMKDDYYNYVPKQRPKKGAINRQGINRQGINRGGINRGSTGSK